MQDPDELFSVRNQYYVGNFEGVFAEAESVRLDESSALFAEKQLFVQLARLAQGETEFENDSGQTGVEFLALELLFRLSDAEESDVQGLLSELKRLVDEDASQNARLRLIAASGYMKYSSDPNDALRILFQVKSSLEVMLMQTYIYVHMHRLDLAHKVVNDMRSVDEDSALSQLAIALISMFSHETVQESVEILRELVAKWVATPFLISALSSALVLQGKFEEALEAVEEIEEPTSELYLNSICAAQHMGDRLDDFIAGLKQVEPDHSWFKEMAVSSTVFDEACSKFQLQ